MTIPFCRHTKLCFIIIKGTNQWAMKAIEEQTEDTIYHDLVNTTKDQPEITHRKL